VTFLDPNCKYEVSKNPFVTKDSLMHHRTLGRTEKGHIVLIPEKSAIGDYVMLIDAARTPFILRQKQRNWILIGEAYIYGMMFGEAWDEKRAVRIELV